MRRVLNRLYKCGLVSRSGTGNFSWKLLKQEWDRNWPFKNHPDTMPKKEEDTPPKYHNHSFSTVPTNKWPHTSTPEPPPPSVSNAETEQKLESVMKLILALVSEHKEVKERVDTHGSLLDDLRTMKQSFAKELTIKRWDGKSVKLKDKILPKQFERARDLAECRRNSLYVGPAGCGKTYLAKLVADSLMLDFAAISCTAGMSEAHLLGRSVPDLTHGKNRFQGTEFLRLYEEGGVFLLDEVDAADPNMMLALNSALANGYIYVPNRPDKPIAHRHKDFAVIATANTVGRGATRMYAGRNQLDEATLDRFRIGVIECDYDPSVEKAVCPDIGGEEGRTYVPPVHMNGHDHTIDKLVALGYNLRDTCLFIRHKIEQSGMRRICSSRFMEDAYVMMKHGKWTVKQCMEAYFSGWTSEEKAKIL